MDINAYRLAERFSGLAEAAGSVSNPAILAMLRLDGEKVEDDATSWCSAFANYIAWLLRLPRSKSLAARSWLAVGIPVALEEAKAGFDVVVFWRGKKDGWQGHVGFFAGYDPLTHDILVLGGNQGDVVSIARYSADKLLGIRRLA